MSFLLDALFESRPKSAAGGADFRRIHSPPERGNTAFQSGDRLRTFLTGPPAAPCSKWHNPRGLNPDCLEAISQEAKNLLLLP